MPSNLYMNKYSITLAYGLIDNGDEIRNILLNPCTGLDMDVICMNMLRARKIDDYRFLVIFWI